MNKADKSVKASIGEIGDVVDDMLEDAAGEEIGYILMTVPLGRAGWGGFQSNIENKAQLIDILKHAIVELSKNNRSMDS